MDPELLRKVEAVLFASGRFIDATRIAELLEANPKQVDKALALLRENYGNTGTALQVIEEDGAWKLHVADAYLGIVSKIVSDTEVSGPVLETLSVIAWRSPAIQSEVVDVRGSNAYEHIKELVDRGFVVKEPEGRSYRLRITDKFFDYFDIEGRDDIRKIFKDVEEAHRKKELEVELKQKRLQHALEKAEGLDGESQQNLDQALRSVGEGNTAVIDEDPQSKKDVSIDDLEETLLRAQRSREALAKDLDDIRGTEEENAESEASDVNEDDSEEKSSEEEPSEEPPKEVETLEDAQEVRESVEKKIDEIVKN